MEIFFLNGIRDSIATSTGQLAQPFRDLGYTTIHLYRPTTHFWQSWNKKYLRETAKKLILQIPKRVEGQTRCLVAHSQGSLQSWYMLREWAKVSDEALFDIIVMISPAMNRGGWAWEELRFDRMLVIYNPDDLAIWMGGAIPGHYFGWAGCQGFRTDDPRIEQRSDSTLADGFLGHMHYFRPAIVRDTADMIDRFISQA